MKNTQLTTCPKIVKWAFVVFNIFLGALGIVLFALGVRVVTVTASVPPQSVAGQDSLLTMLVIAGGVLHFICGIVIFALAVVGVLGAVIQARLLLVIYATMLSAITVIQFIGVIVPLVALSPSANLTPILSSLLTQFIREYTLPPTNAGQNNFIDNIQNTSSCCGVNNATDWMERARCLWTEEYSHLPAAHFCLVVIVCSTLRIFMNQAASPGLVMIILTSLWMLVPQRW